MKTKIFLVAGARPNFMKIAPLYWELSRSQSRFEPIIVHTGQHYDHNMSGAFFQDLELPEPDYHLGVGSGTHARQTARVMEAFEDVVEEIRPAAVLVVGDVNSTLACSLTTSKMNFGPGGRIRPRIAHVEAGLRSFDDSMPEEINRRLTDAVSDILFVSEPSGIHNLKNEGYKNIVKGGSPVSDQDDYDWGQTPPFPLVMLVGNVMIDSLFHVLDRVKKRDPFQKLGMKREHKYPLVSVTIHRPSNVDRTQTLRLIMETLVELAEEAQVIFPVHPRTRKRIRDTAIPVSGRLHLADPVGYLDFLALQYNSSLVITDSGGIQEETTALNVPCITVRENTERPITISQGTNQLVEISKEGILSAARSVLAAKSVAGRCPDLWDGHAAGRIAAGLDKTVF